MFITLVSTSCAIVGAITTYSIIKYICHRSVYLHTRDLVNCRNNLIDSPDYCDNIVKQQKVQEITTLLSDYYSKKNI